MGIGDNITLNSFSFCKDHGNEVCWTHCFCDHREDNNATIQGLSAILNKGPSYDVNERKQICVFAVGLVAGKKPGTYKCQSHGKDQCKKCFNWTKLIQKQEQ